MRKFALLAVIVAGPLVGALLAQSPERPKERNYLKQLVGEWTYETEASLEAGKPHEKISGTERVRAMGEQWVIAEHEATILDQPFTGILTLGLDDHRHRYIGTWIDSHTRELLRYEGSLDDHGKAITLLTETPHPAASGKRVRFREVIEVKDKEHKVLTTSMQGDDGQWAVVQTINYRRRQPGADREQTQAESNRLGDRLRDENAVKVHYLEIVTPAVNETCDALANAHRVTFGQPIAELGNARTATLKDGGRIGVRAPMRETEAPVVRPYVLVDDIDVSLKAAEKAGAQVAMHPTKIRGQGTFAIYVLGGVDHGLWQLESRQP